MSVDTYEIEAIKRFVPNDGIAIDVGACLGRWTEAVLKNTQGTIVHAFEPSPKTFPLFNRGFGDHKRVVANNLGVGDKITTAKLHIMGAAGYWGCSSLSDRQKTAPQLNRSEGVVDINITTLDTYWASLSHIDFLKIDVEGFEYHVLCGADRLLTEHWVKVIQFEFGYTCEDAGTNWDIIATYLGDRGYTIQMIMPDFSMGDPLIDYTKPRHTNNYIARRDK